MNFHLEVQTHATEKNYKEKMIMLLQKHILKTEIFHACFSKNLLDANHSVKDTGTGCFTQQEVGTCSSV